MTDSRMRVEGLWPTTHSAVSLKVRELPVLRCRLLVTPVIAFRRISPLSPLLAQDFVRFSFDVHGNAIDVRGKVSPVDIFCIQYRELVADAGSDNCAGVPIGFIDTVLVDVLEPIVQSSQSQANFFGSCLPVAAISCKSQSKIERRQRVVRISRACLFEGFAGRDEVPTGILSPAHIGPHALPFYRTNLIGVTGVNLRSALKVPQRRFGITTHERISPALDVTTDLKCGAAREKKRKLQQANCAGKNVAFAIYSSLHDAPPLTARYPK